MQIKNLCANIHIDNTKLNKCAVRAISQKEIPEKRGHVPIKISLTFLEVNAILATKLR